MAWNPPKPPKPEPYILRVANAPFWTLVEVAFAVIAACLPPLGSLIRCSPSPKRLLSSARRKMSSASARTSGSSGRKRSHPWGKWLDSDRLEKGDSEITFVNGQYSHSTEATQAPGKKSEESAPTISNNDFAVSSMGASGMWNDAHDHYNNNIV